MCSVSAASPAPLRSPKWLNVDYSDLVDKGKEQVSEVVERGREVVDRGRAQWDEFVERGKSLVSEQAGRVNAAVDAGRAAYKVPTIPVEPTEL